MATLDPSFERAWHDFQQLEALTSVSESLEGQWARGRAQYLTFLIRLEDAAAQRYAAGVIDRLAAVPGVEPYPDWYWHMTVKGAGFQVIKRTHDDDILRQDVPRIAALARKLLAAQPAFELQVGPANGFPEVVFLEVRDGGRIRELNTLLCEQLPGLARYPFDGARFLPHVSIARFTSNDGLAQLKETLAALRDEAPGPRFAAGRVELIKAWLTEAVPEFETLASYPLASGPATS